MTVRNKSVSVKGKVKPKTKRLKKKSSTASVKAGCRTSGNGTLSFAKKSGAAGIRVTKSGDVYAAAGPKMGTYKVKITVKASKTLLYKAATKTMTVEVKVKK